jgi:acetylglutamate kinase
VALGAEKVVYLTDVDGLLADVDDPDSLIRRIHPEPLRAMIDHGALTGGMIPKVAACVHATVNGVRSAHMIDGTVPHVLLLEIFTDEGIGTMVSREVPEPTPEAT